MTKSILGFIAAILLYPFHANAGPIWDGQMTWENGQFTQAITGTVDIELATLTVDPWEFFTVDVHTSDVSMFTQQGDYQLSGGNFSLAQDQVGAHMLLTRGNLSFYVIMVWDVINQGDHYSYVIVDSDGDGQPGHAVSEGGYAGTTFYYEFKSNPPGADVGVSLLLPGGANIECTGNSMAQVSAGADVQLFGDAVLESVTWTLDGNPVESGTTFSELLSLGSYELEVTALITNGFSATDGATVSVEDTTTPDIYVRFLNTSGIPTDLAEPGQYMLTINPHDTCDPDVEVGHSDIRKIYDVQNGTILQVTEELDNLDFPVSGLEVSATATDASGNSNTVEKVLLLE